MMKKSIIISFLILGILGVSFAQNAKVTKGQKYYEFYNYFKTIEKYEELTDKTPDIKRELAESYFNTGEYEKAESYYSELSNSDDKTADDVYNYVKVLLINQKYQEAEKWMAEFKNLAPTDTRAELFASNKGFYHDISEDKGYFAIKNLDFNTDDEDFAPVFYKDKVVFSSTRQDVEPIKRKWTWNNLPFLDLYIAELDSGSLEFASYEKFNFNKKFHEGTVSFNKEGDYLVYTSNNYKKKSEDGIYKLEMFSSKLEKGKWGKPVPMPFNNSEYSVGHASLSADGKVMYFASDISGGFGGVDLFISTMDENGVWSQPVNLGPDINTEGNEMFPFIHPDGYLFFASDGRPGLGGLDIFVAKVQNGREFTNLQNLGAPVNTNFDDFSLVLNDEMTKGYFSSNRISGKGNDDIYSFDLLVPFFSTKTIVGTAVDGDVNILAGVDVYLFDNTGKIINKSRTSVDGKYKFDAEDDKNYTVTGKKQGYSDDAEIVNTSGTQTQFETTLILKRVPEFSLYCLILDDKTKEPIDSVAIILVNKAQSDQVLAFSTDSLGEHLNELENISLNDTNTYSVAIKKDGYLPINSEVNIVFDHEGQYDLSEYMKIELHQMNIGDDIAKAINVEPIYFDLNKYNIRPDAAIELDKIVKVMNEYPTLEIELGSHTDSRGSDASNKTLSQNRATSSAKYIKEKITNPERISGKGYGESRFFVVTEDVHAEYDFLPVGQELNNDFIYSLPKNQQEIAHQLNRRTEFKIIKY